MSLSAVSSGLSGMASAQAMFDQAAQATAQLGADGSDAGNGAVGTATAAVAVNVDVAMLRKALDAERSLVNIFA